MGHLSAAVVFAVMGISVSAYAQGIAPAFYGLRPFTDAPAVSDDGLVVLSSVGAGNATWRIGAGPVVLDTAQPYRISANGQVVIGHGNGNGVVRTVIGGTATVLPPLNASGGRRAAGISADGNVVAGNNGRTPWYWTQATGTRGLPGAGAREAFDITRDGQRIVGTAGAQPYIYQIGGALQLIPAIPGREVTQFRRVSGDGLRIVGSAFSGGSTGQVGEAFRWTAAGGYQTLGSIGSTPDLIQTYYANSVDFAGNTIGGTQGGRAWIWTAAGGMRDFRSVLVNDLALPNLANWTFINIHDISADGRFVVGLGQFRNQAGGLEDSAFLAVIPAPTTTAPFVLVAILALRRRCRPSTT